MQGTNLQKIVPFLAYFQLFCDLFSQKSKTGFMRKNIFMQYNKHLYSKCFQKREATVLWGTVVVRSFYPPIAAPFPQPGRGLSHPFFLDG